MMKGDKRGGKDHGKCEGEGGGAEVWTAGDKREKKDREEREKGRVGERRKRRSGAARKVGKDQSGESIIYS